MKNNIEYNSSKDRYLDSQKDIREFQPTTTPNKWEEEFDEKFTFTGDEEFMGTILCFHQETTPDQIKSFIRSLISETEERIYKLGFKEGFGASGEGYNGEYVNPAKPQNHLEKLSDESFEMYIESTK